MDLKKESSRLEQQALTLSLVCVIVIALGTLAWGLAIESDVVILNGVEGLRAGGSEVDASNVIWFGSVSGVICATFSLVTLAGFAALFVLEEPLSSIWARYADSALGPGQAAPTDLERRGSTDRRCLAHHQFHRGSAPGMSTANHALCGTSGIRQNGCAVRACLRLQRLAGMLAYGHKSHGVAGSRIRGVNLGRHEPSFQEYRS